MRRKPLAPLTPEQQKLAADNEKLIWFFLKKYASGSDLQELYGVAAEGLIRAAATYDPARGKFSTHAMYHMRSAVDFDQSYAKRKKRSGKPVLHMDDVDVIDQNKECNAKMCDVVPLQDRPCLSLDETGADVERFLRSLHARDRELVRMRIVGYTIKEIGDTFGITIQAASAHMKRIANKWESFELYGTQERKR
ncbi:MAG: sigma-70 family RNA polymerase sigma factor [Ruminococcus bromii]|nr:sigma-70 family RNA polymerase sigma factor [Ruminococcus bromii]